MDDYKPLSQKELERGYYFLTHRPMLMKTMYGVAIVILVLVYLVVVNNVIKYVTGTSFNTLALQMDKNPDWASYHQNRVPQDIDVSATQFLSIGGGRYNLLAKVSNPNDDWSVSEFSYTFIVNGKALESKTSFLNPSEEHLLLEIGHESTQAISDLKVIIDDIKWRRWENDTPVILWQTKDITFKPLSREVVGKDTITVQPRVTWEAINMSLYHFWEVDWQVVLYSADRVIAVAEVKAQDFDSLESRQLEAVWLNDLPRVTRTEVWPLLNWLDSDNFKEVTADREDGNRVGL